MKDLAAALKRRRKEQLYRVRRLVEGPQAAQIRVEGQDLLSFCSNDYLGLASDPRLVEAVQKGMKQYGVGSGAAHLVTGHTLAHHRLEEELAEFTGRSRALLFSTGYMANLGVITALTERKDSVFEDRLNHASLIDAAQLSQASMKRYQHLDMGMLDSQLLEANGDKLVATDGVFSMDGDMAPLLGLVKTCAKHNAWLMVDDAHGFGVLGPEGRGSLAQFGLSQDQVPILMGTLGKALGTFGAFVAGSEDLIETLIQQARSYLYTTAPPAAIAEATRVSLEIAKREQWRRDRLQSLVNRFRQEAKSMGLQLFDSETAIQPVLAGTVAQALSWSRQLEQDGILVTAIRPPTVPQGTARLRITFSANHEQSHLDRLLDSLSGLRQEAA